MGSRRNAGYGSFIRAQAPRQASKQLKQSLVEKETPSVTVGAAITLIAQSQPSINTLLATYKLSKALYNISCKAYKEYKKSGEVDAAVRKVAEVTIRHAIPYVKSHLISNAIDIGWGAIKQREGITTSETEDRILTSAAKDTLSKVIRP
jgi:hypothetical protein